MASKKLYALSARGWQRATHRATKKLTAGVATLEYRPGLYGGPRASESRTLSTLRLDCAADALSPVDVSELVLDRDMLH